MLIKIRNKIGIRDRNKDKKERTCSDVDNFVLDVMRENK